MRGENIIDDRYHSTVVYCTYITFISSMIVLLKENMEYIMYFKRN